MAKIKRKRPDAQITGMAGEFLVAGKLFKRDFQVSLTLGNAKAIDLFALNPRTGKTVAVQVKTVRYPNAFPMRRENIDRGRIYVFVILNEPDKDEDYFVVPGEDILGDINHFFGTSYIREKPPRFPGVNYGPLKPYRNRWDVFNRKTAEES